MRVCENSKLSAKTKMTAYNACIISTLPYGSETSTAYVKQEKRFNIFLLEVYPPHPGYIVEGQSIQHWSSVSRRPNNHVHSALTAQVSMPGSFSSYGGWPNSQRHPLRGTCKWQMGHRLPSVALQTDMNVFEINGDHWEDFIAYCSRWRSILAKQLVSGKEKKIPNLRCLLSFECILVYFLSC